MENMNITVELLKLSLSDENFEKAYVIENSKKTEKVKLADINYKNENLLKEKGYLLYKDVKEIKEVNGIIEIHV